MVFPVRFVAGKRLVDTFARELSERGVALSSAAPPVSGTIIGMQLFLPSAPAPCAATGLVVGAESERGPAGERSFWTEFTGLTRGSDAVIAALLTAGQRGSRRPAVDFKVSCRIGDKLIYESAENVSRGGVFVRARTPPPLETIVEAHLELPDGMPPAAVRARVAHATPRGFGLQFLDGDLAFRARVQSLVTRLCA